MKVFIMGMGWLGGPLGRSLVEKGHDVSGTYRGTKPIDFPTALPFEIGRTPLRDLGKKLASAEVLVFAIPPSSWLRDYIENQKLRRFLAEMANEFSGKAVLISSIGVFGSNQLEVDESTIPEPDSERGSDLKVLERFWSKSFNSDSIVVRLGGLVGGDRHPVRYLSGRSNVSGRLHPINLIDRQSVINLIEKILLSPNLDRTVYHGVSAYHPDRESFYRSSAERLALPLPEFDQNDRSRGKKVNGLLTQNEFNLSSREEDLYP